MTEDFSSSQPIYLQLVDRICREVVRGKRKAGEKLPSVREMAIQSGVNPNTMQRVYAELEQMAVVETRRGQGTFVTSNENRLQQLRNDLMQEGIRVFIQDMCEMGFTPPEIVQGVEDHLRQLVDGSKYSREDEEE